MLSCEVLWIKRLKSFTSKAYSRCQADDNQMEHFTKEVGINIDSDTAIWATD